MVDNQDKIAYLQLIQEPISRMSTISSIIKGFCITVVSGLLCVFFDNDNYYILLLSIFAIFIFMSLDVYYLRLERRFRYLYNAVVEDKVEINFSMKLVGTHEQNKSRIIDCLLSFNIWFFYLMPVLLILFIFHIGVMGVM